MVRIEDRSFAAIRVGKSTIKDDSCKIADRKFVLWRCRARAENRRGRPGRVTQPRRCEGG
jgi:hypothetical protein